MGSCLGQVKILLLSTTGRQSGMKRTVPLTAIPYGGEYLVVASFGGSSIDPDWLTNIRYNPVVETMLGSAMRRGEAEIITLTDPRYEELWGMAVATYHGFDSYKRATSRHIPIVVINFCDQEAR